MKILRTYFAFILLLPITSFSSKYDEISKLLNESVPGKLVCFLSGKISRFQGTPPTKWVRARVGGGFDEEPYEIEVSITGSKIIAKPIDEWVNNSCCGKSKGYHTSDYEDLFFFKDGHCKDFNPNSMADITSAIR